jgi:hypothetical protein
LASITSCNGKTNFLVTYSTAVVVCVGFTLQYKIWDWSYNAGCLIFSVYCYWSDLLVITNDFKFCSAEWNLFLKLIMRFYVCQWLICQWFTCTWTRLPAVMLDKNHTASWINNTRLSEWQYFIVEY